MQSTALQNLSQTPGLESVITDRNKKHIVETIPATTVEDSESEDIGSEGEEGEEERTTNDKQPEQIDKKFQLVLHSYSFMIK